MSWRMLLTSNIGTYTSGHWSPLINHTTTPETAESSCGHSMSPTQGGSSRNSEDVSRARHWPEVNVDLVRHCEVFRLKEAHQVDVVTQHILQHRAYDYNWKTNDNVYHLSWFWSLEPSERKGKSPVPLLVNCVGIGVHYVLDALTQLARWFHTMNHMHYVRWIPVHLKDMTELSWGHPEVLSIKNV
jgi:hypothetical protein